MQPHRLDCATILVIFLAISIDAIGAAPLPEQSHWPDPLVRAEPHIRSCMRDHPIERVQVERLKYADFADGPVPELQCFVRCFMDRSNFYDTDGRLNVERAVAGLSYDYQQAYAPEVMSVCRHVAGTSDCDTAYQVFKCFKQSIIAH